MNTRLTLLGLFAGSFTLAASAQRVSSNDQPLLRPIGLFQPDRDTQQESGERGGSTVVWSEDFSNGMAGNNPSGAWTTDGPNGDIWKISTTGPLGFYTPASQRIQSATFENGFAKFASDSANCTWSGDTPTALPQNQFTSWEGSLVSPVIDLSLNPQVEVVFEQRSRFCCGTSPFFFEVTTDGGTTWTAFLSNDGLSANQDPTFTETRRFSIASLIAESPSTVQFRFHHNSEAGTSHYHWQVDDIRIMMLPEYEMRMNYAYTSTTGTGEEYGRIPVTQLPATMNIGAEVVNYGATTQTNTSVECVITTQSGTEVLTQTTPLGDLTAGQTLVSDDWVNLPFMDLGRYNATFSINSDFIDQDGDSTDNAKVRNFELTSGLYSLDALGNYPPGEEVRQQLGTASFTDNTTLNIMTMYQIFAQTQALSATVVLGTNTRAGAAATIEVFLLDTADVLNIASSTVDLPIDGVTSDLVTITQQHVTAGQITIPLSQPVPLAPGAYYLCARISGSGTAAASDPEVYIADDNTVPQPGSGTMIWLPIDFNDDGTEGRHVYGNGNAAAIRLNVTPFVGIEENDLATSVSLFPNPTTGLLTIQSDLTGKLNVEVIDLLGAVVRTTTFTGRSTMDLHDLAKGVYNVRVSNGDHTTVERITLH